LVEFAHGVREVARFDSCRPDQLANNQLFSMSWTEESATVCFVQCYGNYDYEREDEELLGLQEFYTEVGHDILREQPAVIVLMGGYTSNDISEAESTFIEFFESFFDLYNLDEEYEPVVLFQNSGHTASQNLLLSLFTIQRYIKHLESLTIYVDDVRLDKTKKISDALYGAYLAPTIKCFHRRDIHPHSKSAKQNELIESELQSELFISYRKTAGELLKSLQNKN
jgi:hypothetical protein